MRASIHLTRIALIGTAIVCAMVVLPAGATQPAEQPEVAAAVVPAYPPVAIAVKASGTVLVDTEIDEAGKVVAAKGISGHPLLRRTAENTARRWVFTPAGSRRNTHLTFVFRIMPKEATADDLAPIFTPPYKVEVRSRPAEPTIHSDPPSYTRPTRQRLKRRT